jgi:hypothetical protein
MSKTLLPQIASLANFTLVSIINNLRISLDSDIVLIVTGSVNGL